MFVCCGLFVVVCLSPDAVPRRWLQQRSVQRQEVMSAFRTSAARRLEL
jgi:hypothetical protein